MARVDDDSDTTNEVDLHKADGPVLVWFRRDLRIGDNLALNAAIASGHPVTALFILDDTKKGPRSIGGAQRWWLHHSLKALKDALGALDVQFVLRRGGAQDVLDGAIEDAGARTVLWNRRYDAAGAQVDAAIKKNLRERGLTVESFAGQLLHEPTHLLTGKGDPYRVYTPFWRAFEKTGEPRAPIGAPEKAAEKSKSIASENLEDWDLLPTKPDWSGGIADTWQPGEKGAWARLEDFISGPFSDYDTARDRPDKDETSRLSPHLAFGEITPYQIWEETKRRPQEVDAGDRVTYRKELVWREFAYHLLFHFPSIDEANFNDRFDSFPWADKGESYKAWCKGRTGYPIVDAGMRQLWQTGWMHNRVRMIVASFLTKHLLIDWREGERWFWDTLVDADPASNPSQWQWVAGSGADAAPYFRIFNPIIQGEKFDPGGDYVRRYVPELAKLTHRHIHKPWEAPADALKDAGVTLGSTYPNPVVDHKKARQRALDAYEKVKDAA